MRKTLGSLLTTIALLWASGADAQQPHTSYAHITTDATTIIKTAPGVLTSVCVNTATATEVITIFDSPTASGAVIAVLTIPATPVPNCFAYFVNFQIGLTVLTATAVGDITVGYQ